MIAARFPLPVFLARISWSILKARRKTKEVRNGSFTGELICSFYDAYPEQKIETRFGDLADDRQPPGF